MNNQNDLQLTCGAAGGPKIITAVLQALVRAIDLGQSIDTAIASPRIHHQWSPDKLAYEEALAPHVSQALQQTGHTLDRGKTLAVAQGIERLASGQLVAASDPRVPSAAAGLP